MSLTTFQIDLQETNRLLARIADALDRAVPVEPTFVPSSGERGKRVQSTSPAANYHAWEQEMHQTGRGDEVLAGAYGPRSLRRN